MMKKNIVKNIFKVSFISILIILAFNIGSIVIEASNNANNNSTKNKNNYKKLESSDISKTGVAITINLAIRHSDKNSISENIFRKIYSVKEVLENLDLAKKELIINDMLYTKEYFSMLKTDFRKTIKSSKNKEAILKEIIEQLKIRKNLGEKQIKNITEQRKILLKGIDLIEKELETLKEKINTDFKKTDSEEIKKDIDRYLDLKNKYYQLRTFIIFENKFLNYYKILNNYNKEFLEVFSLNKDIIIKGSYLVIPNKSSEILKDYGLLYEQNDFKNLKENKKTE